jgi:hypothetical protein
MAHSLSHELLAIATLTMIVLVATSVFSAFAAPTDNNSNAPHVKIQISVYSNHQCTDKTLRISWGTVQPGTSKNAIVYVANTGNLPVTLNLTILNWRPSDAFTYFEVTWNREGQVLRPGSVVVATLTLLAHENASQVADFGCSMMFSACEFTK